MKTKFGKKLLSVLMAFAMLVSLVQGTGIAASVAKAADDQKYVTLHFYNTYNWSTPAIQYWGGDAEVTNYGETGEITGWGVNGYTLTAEGDNWYKITLKGGFNAFQFLDFSNPGSNTKSKGYAEEMKYCTKSEATDLYCKWGAENDYNTEWYLDKNYTTSIETLVPADALKESTMTFHYKNTENWAKVAVMVAEGGSWTSIKGFEQFNTWPGVELEKDADGYYTVTVKKDASVCNVIFNNNGKKNEQTKNICITPTKETEEYWISGYGEDGTVISDTKPEKNPAESDKEEEKKDENVTGDINATESNVTVHFANTEGYEEVYAHVWEQGGAGLTGNWPGQSLTKDEDGYYTINFPAAKIGQLNFIYNNGKGQQTEEAHVKVQLTNEEYWLTNGELTDSKPGNDATEQYVQLHYFIPTEWKWEQPALQYWGGTKTEASTECLGHISGWGENDIAYALDVDTTTTKGTWYKITLKGDFTGFQFLDFKTPSNNTAGVGYASAMTYANKLSAVNVFLAAGTTDWFLDRELTTSIDTLIPEGTPTETTITVHFKNTNNWEQVAAYACQGGSWVSIPGYEAMGKEADGKDNWPGQVVEADEDGWYTVSITKNMEALDIIFDNNNKGSQTGNIIITPKKAIEEYWVVDDVVTDYLPTTFTMHYYADSWSSVYAYLTEGEKWTAISGYTAAGSWPGSSIKKDSKNANWYTVTVKKDNSQFNVIFNNNEGTQTGDITIVPTKEREERWITGVGDDGTKVSETAPEGWVVSDDNDIYVDDKAVQPTRFVVVEYVRPAGDYDNWNIYCWDSGWGKKTEECYPVELNGKQYIVFPVKESTQDFNIGFCMRYTTAENAWAEKDGGDHHLDVPAGQNVVHAVFEQGKGITAVYPYNTGYEMQGEKEAISFYYRNDELVLTNEEASLEGKVKVVVNGVEYAMDYNAANERYEVTLNDCETGDYAYYYVVDGKETLDAFNANKTEFDGRECSVITYKNFEDLSIEASVLNDSMDYNDNNVLSVKLVGTDADNVKAEEIASITADVSELGLDTISVTPELMEKTFAVLDTVAAGEKTISIEMKDIYGNIYKTATKVNVVKRDNDGFDWDEAIIYFAVTDRFFDGNEENNTGVKENDVDKTGSLSYHGGDFAGLQAKLDYLQELGVNTVWITPIVAQSDITTTKDEKEIESTGYHGYWASSFEELNGHLGTEEEFSALINALHARGMKLMVDVVLNHAGYNTEDYFNTIIQDENGNYVAMIRDESNTIEGDNVYDSLSNLPDFATENDAIRDQLIDWQTNWVEKYGIDYFRVDTVKHVDTTTWEELKNELTKIDPDFKMIGEYSGGGYTTLPSYEGAMDSLLDFDTNDQAQNFVKGEVENVEKFFESRNSSINNTSTTGLFLSSHDENGLLYKLINADKLDEETATNLFKVAAALQMTAKGQVVIYYGEEIGQTGADNYPYQTNRRDFDWDEMEKQAGETDSMFNHYKKLLAIRNANTDVLAKGTRTAVAVSNEKGYDVFTRTYGNEKLYVALNVKDAQKVTFAVDAVAGSVLTDLYSGATYTVAADKTVTINLASPAQGGTAILKVTSVPAISVAPASTAAGQVIKAAVANVKNTVSNIVRRITGRRNRTQAAAQTEEVVADEETTVEETEEAADAEEITVESNDSEEIVTIEEAATPTAAEKSLPVAPIAAGVVVLIVVATSLTVVMKKKKY